MTGLVEWPMLLTIVSCIVLTVGITGAIIIRVFTWVYADSNQHRARADDLHRQIGMLRTEVAQTYVTHHAQNIIKEAIDQRGDHLENAVNRLSDSVDRMTEKHDRSIGELVKALAAKAA